MQHKYPLFVSPRFTFTHNILHSWKKWQLKYQWVSILNHKFIIGILNWNDESDKLIIICGLFHMNIEKKKCRSRNFLKKPRDLVGDFQHYVEKCKEIFLCFRFLVRNEKNIMTWRAYFFLYQPPSFSTSIYINRDFRWL